MDDGFNFAKDRLICLAAATADPTLSHLDVRLLARIVLRYLNRVSGYAWPSVATLARDLDVCERSIQRSIRVLEERGYLWVTRRGGSGRTNHFRIRIPPSYDERNRRWRKKGDTETGLTVTSQSAQR